MKEEIKSKEYYQGYKDATEQYLKVLNGLGVHHDDKYKNSFLEIEKIVNNINSDVINTPPEPEMKEKEEQGKGLIKKIKRDYNSVKEKKKNEKEAKRKEKERKKLRFTDKDFK